MLAVERTFYGSLGCAADAVSFSTDCFLVGGTHSRFFLRFTRSCELEDDSETPRLGAPAVTRDHVSVTLAFPHREDLSDNLACGPNISCQRPSGAGGPPDAHSSTRPRSIVDGQPSAVTGQCTRNAPEPKVHFE